MKMSTRGRFGLRALLHLAEDTTRAPLSVSALAGLMDVSADYLMQLFVKMRRAGLIKSIRGPRGGFVLSKPAGKISVGDVLRAVEGPLQVTDCANAYDCNSRKRKRPPTRIKVCPFEEKCTAKLVWDHLSREITHVLDTVNLQQVVVDARRRGILQ